MISRKNLLICLAVPAVALSAAGGALVSTAFAQNGGRVAQAPSNPEVALSAEDMSGANEVPTAGDPDGTGLALVKVNPVTYDVCIGLTTQNIAAFTALHIHRGATGVSGPPIVDFSPGAGPGVQKCVVSTAAITAEILGNPAGFYVNVHTTEFPAGALRAQLVARGGEMRLLDAPVRAYDSRTADGVLAAAGTRTIGLNTAGVPIGTRGALVTITVTGTTGSGFLTAYSAALIGGVPNTSTINWTAANQDVATTTVVGVDGQGRIKVTTGPNGGAQVIVDVIGFVV